MIDCFKNSNRRREQKNQQDKSEKTEEKPKKESAKKAETDLLFFSAMTTQIQDDIWCIDSGASTHMSYRRDWFTNYLKTDKKEVNCANDVKLTSEGIGDIRVNLEDTEKELNINNVSHVSGLNTNLLSISAMVKKNMSVFFSKEGCKIFKNNDIKVQGEPILEVNEKNGIYVLGTNNDGCST